VALAVYAIRGVCNFFRRDTVYGRFELLDDPDPDRLDQPADDQ